MYNLIAEKRREKMRIPKKTGLVVALTLTLTLTAFLATMPTAHASTITLNTIADSWVESRYPTVNHGGNVTLHVRSDIYLPEPDPTKKNRTKRTFLKFDLSGIDPNTIDTVTLYLYCTANNGSDTIDVYAHQTGDGWAEYSINWDNQPAIGPLITILPVDGAGYWYGWGGEAMKNYVKAEAAGDDIVSFVLKLFDDENPTHTAPPEYHRDFSSKEGGYSPYLEITELPPPPVGGHMVPITMAEESRLPAIPTGLISALLVAVAVMTFLIRCKINRVTKTLKVHSP